MPMTPSIIRQMHKLAELDHMPKGVDYDAKVFDDDDYSTDEDNDDSDSKSEGDSKSECDKVDKNKLPKILNELVLSKDHNHPSDQSDNEE
eukprot:2613646-Ditylum_brightwellii.AAC.1